jgi:hypothetical protein
MQNSEIPMAFICLKIVFLVSLESTDFVPLSGLWLEYANMAVKVSPARRTRAPFFIRRGS